MCSRTTETGTKSIIIIIVIIIGIHSYNFCYKDVETTSDTSVLFDGIIKIFCLKAHCCSSAYSYVLCWLPQLAAVGVI